MSHETALPIVALAALAALTLDQRKVHLRWLGELTQLPTASGKEWRVIRWVERWASERSDVVLSRDPSGNITLSLARMAAGSRPVYFTGHLDHPAFVVERIVSPSTLELSFRGGVMDDYFKEAKVAVYNARDEVVKGTITESLQGPAFKHYLVELASGSTMHHALGDVGVWDLPRAEVKDGNFHTLACDDLAAVAAALAAFDVLRAIAARGELRQDVRVLLTRAEEIGFIGAIAAVKHGTIPADARVMALENSRSFAESPIGGGPIVRVGDRLSVFSPTLTDAIAARAEQVAGGASTVTAAQKASALPAWKWQRKLMAGGACEASVFFHSGLEATCVCLPLGNYHNMGDLAAVQAGTNTTRPTIEREFIGVSDYEGLVDLLVACGVHLPAAGGMGDRLERLWKQHAEILK